MTVSKVQTCGIFVSTVILVLSFLVRLAIYKTVERSLCRAFFRWGRRHELTVREKSCSMAMVMTPTSQARKEHCMQLCSQENCSKLSALQMSIFKLCSTFLDSRLTFLQCDPEQNRHSKCYPHLALLDFLLLECSVQTLLQLLQEQSTAWNAAHRDSSAELRGSSKDKNRIH